MSLSSSATERVIEEDAMAYFLKFVARGTRRDVPHHLIDSSLHFAAVNVSSLSIK